MDGLSRARKDDLIFAGEVAQILGIERTQAWRLLRAGIIQQAVQNVETRMWSAPRAQVEALRIERERSLDGRVKKPGQASDEAIPHE